MEQHLTARALTTMRSWGILTANEVRERAEQVPLAYPAEWLLDIFNGAGTTNPYTRRPYEPNIVTGNENVLWWAFPAFTGWLVLALGLVTWLVVR